MERSRTAIVASFDDAGQRVYLPKELAEVFHQQRTNWNLGDETRLEEFVAFLLARTELRSAILESAEYSSVKRYTWGAASIYDLATSLRESAHFSHASAVHLHGLSPAIPRTLYVNREQSPKPVPEGELTQEGLRRAFSRPQRVSNYTYRYGEHEVTILSGKHTKRHSVITMSGPHGRPLETTTLERTLIDIAVRPFYAGGVTQVCAAFASALGRVSIAQLMSTLNALDYMYPYHQAIGFYLDRCGANQATLAPLKELGMKYDFYLAHGMKDAEYSNSWRVYHPREM